MDRLVDRRQQSIGVSVVLGTRTHEYAGGKGDKEIMLDLRVLFALEVRPHSIGNYLPQFLLDMVHVDAWGRKNESEHQIPVAFGQVVGLWHQKQAHDKGETDQDTDP